MIDSARVVLRAVWAEVLGLDEVNDDDNFFVPSGDSLLCMRTINLVQHRSFRFTLLQRLEYQTIDALAPLLERQEAEAARLDTTFPTGLLPLTLPQSWLLIRLGLEKPYLWSTSMTLEASEPLARELVEVALARLAAYHEVLRVRFVRLPQAPPKDSLPWQQVLSDEPSRVALDRFDLSESPEDEQDRLVVARIDALLRTLNLEHGPLFRAALFDLGMERPHRLTLVVHHLLSDGASWQILLDDFQYLYRAFEEGPGPTPLARTTSYGRWEQRLMEYARSDELLQESSYWLAPKRLQHHPLPVEFPQGRNTESSWRTRISRLDARERHVLIHDVTRVCDASTFEILVTAFAQAVMVWTAREMISVVLCHHGRDTHFLEIDLSHTVGRITIGFPTRLEGPLRASNAACVDTVKEQLRRVPNFGHGFGMLSRIPNPQLWDQLNALPTEDLPPNFNYRGRDFALGQKPLLSYHDNTDVINDTEDDNLMPHLVEAYTYLGGDHLRVVWLYSANLFEDMTIDRLSTIFEGTLREMIREASAALGGAIDSNAPAILS